MFYELYEDVADETFKKMHDAEEIYGDFTSTHEALGVALEEWNELQHAIHANKLESIREEALDLAAVLLRMAHQCCETALKTDFAKRSVK